MMKNTLGGWWSSAVSPQRVIFPPNRRIGGPGCLRFAALRLGHNTLLGQPAVALTNELPSDCDRALQIAADSGFGLDHLTGLQREVDLIRTGHHVINEL